MLFEHLAPGDGGREAVLESEFRLEKFVHAANDVGDDRLRSVKDSALNLQLLVIGGEKVLVKVNNGIFTPCAVAEIAQNGRKISLIAAQQFNDFLDPQFV